MNSLIVFRIRYFNSTEKRRITDQMNTVYSNCKSIGKALYSKIPL